MSWSNVVQEALQRTSGARFYRCALQINTPYQKRFQGFDRKRANKPYEFAKLLLENCKQNEIEVIGLADHNSSDYLDTVHDVLGNDGIHVFPGFEIASTEGLHLLCFFDVGKDKAHLDDILAQLDLPKDRRWVDEAGGTPRQSTKSFPQILELVQERFKGICVAAHVTSDNGLFQEAAHTTRADYFTRDDLLAIQIPGSKEMLNDFPRRILGGELEHYRRKRPVAVLNCQDVYSFQDFATFETSCLIKMTDISIEGLRQAFLDPDSRVKLLSDPEPPDHAEIKAIAWEGGFLDGCSIHLNENLNALIGGRGAGKSTVIESLRYAMGIEPLGEHIRKAHEGILRVAVKSGTKISVLVQSHKPSPRQYLIERTYPNPVVVKDENGSILKLLPKDLFPGLEIFGQHEVAEVARDTTKQIHLLSRFRDPDVEDFARRKNDVHRALEENRIELLQAKKNIEAIEDELGRLPLLEETIQRYQDLGLEERLKEQTLIAREEQLLRTAGKRIEELAEQVGFLDSLFPIDRAFLSSKAIGNLPDSDLLTKVSSVLESLDEKSSEALMAASNALSEAKKELEEIKKEWSTRRRDRQHRYEEVLRELQKEAVDGEEFVRLRRQIEALEPMKEQRSRLNQLLRELREKRSKLLDEWEELKRLAYQADDKAAEKVSGRLQNRLKVTLTYHGDITPLETLLREQKKGLRAETFDRINAHNPISIPQFVAALRQGKDSLVKTYGLTPGQSDILINMGEQAFLQIEELDLPSTTMIELNVASERAQPIWRIMDELSTGQKATAILLLLLLESEGPLVVDQPEDDLDNRFIAESIVPRLREEKRRRQFLFATHNANIPVLGDAELIATLEARGEGPRGNAEIPNDHLGSIDIKSVKSLVEQILEGGQEAFQTRRAKYGF